MQNDGPKTDGSASQAQESNQTGVTIESAGESRVANAQLEPSLVSPPVRRVSIDDLAKMLDREPDATLEIMPNGEIREYSEEEKAKIRSERKPLTMRENLVRRLAYRPHQVLAIAAALVASGPGIFGGPDVLGPIRARREPEEDLRPPGGYRIKTEVSFAQRSPDPEQPDLPPLEKRPGHRSGYKVASEAHHVPTSRFHKPAGSKLARKAAKGKL